MARVSRIRVTSVVVPANRAGKLCGERCTVCAPDDFDCFETDEIKACDPEGQCVSDTGDLCPNADTLCGRINDGRRFGECS